MKRFSDFADDDVLDGDKLKIEDVLNMEVVVLAHRIKQSKYETGQCMTIQIEHDDRRRVIFTGSEVLIDQLKKYKEHLPFLATIKKIDRYYSLT